MPITPPDIADSTAAVKVLTWVVGACFTAIGAMFGAFLWLIGKFSERERMVIGSNTAAVESLVDVVEEGVGSVNAVGQHLEVANQQEHDRQLLEADRLRRTGD